MKKEKSVLYVVDFKNRKLLSTQESFYKPKKQVKTKYNFSNFNSVPEDSNFADFSEKDRMEYSEHVLKHIKDASFQDLVHWANMGMVDVVKVSKALGLFEEKLKKSQK